MSTIKNLIDSQTSFLSNTSTTGTGSWIATNATLQRTSKRRKTGPASMLITCTVDGGTTTVYAHTASTAPEIQAGETYRGLMWFHHEIIGRAVKFGVQFYDLTRTAIAYASDHFVIKTQGFAEWTLAYVNVTAPVNAVYATLRVDVENVDTDTSDKFLWIEDAALVTYGIIDCRFLDNMARWIPDWMIIEDSQQKNPQFPMMRFTDLLASKMTDVIDLVSDFDYIPEVEGGPVGDTSSLVDPANFNRTDSGLTTKAEWLPWIAQLVGVRSTRLSIQSGTSWDYLETAYPTWADWETAINDAANTPLTVSTLSRTAGVVSVTTSAAHGLEAGDVITVAGTSITSGSSSDVAFDGYYEVTSASGSNLTFVQQYSILSAIRSGTTVTVITGRPHGFSAGNSITLSNCSVSAFNGTFTVVSVSATGDDGINTFTFTTGSSGSATSYSGQVQPATDKNGTGGTATPSDLKWSFIENANIDGTFDPTSTLAEFIRTGANGVWAGTVEGMKRAARIAMSGTDLQCSLQRIDGTVTVTTTSPHGFTSGDVIIYGAGNPSLNRSYTIGTILDEYSFTVPSGGGNLTNVRGWVTNKQVSITAGYWNGTIDSVVVTSGNNYTITFTQPIPFTTVSGVIVVSDSGASAVNKTHTPTGAVTVASDRLSISFTSDQSTSPQTSAGGKARVPADDLCFIIGTPANQTPGEETILDFVSVAKPAGAVITHEYTA